MGFALPAGLLGLTTLFDFYVGGVRIFDLVFVTLVLALVLVQRDRWLSRTGAEPFVLLFLLATATCAVGVVDDTEALKPSIGIVLGGIASIILASTEWDTEVVARWLRRLMLFHAAMFILQMVAYYGAGIILNYHAWLGITPRLESYVFRAAGLFQEPAHYCLMQFSLLTLHRLIDARDRRIDAIILSTLVMSISLWGWGASIVYLLFFRRRWALAVAPLGAAALAAAAAYVDLSDPIVRRILGRLTGLSEDGSAQTRYGALSRFDFLEWRAWFGRGVTNDYLETGSSGLSFLLAAVGIIGVLAVMFYWLILLPKERRVGGWLVLSFMLSAASLWTMLWWWVWMALAASVPVRATNESA